MAKPILVINVCVDGISRNKAENIIMGVSKVISESNANDDYYTFVLPVHGDSHVQVFYDKDFNKVQYDELKIMIEDKLKSLK